MTDYEIKFNLHKKIYISIEDLQLASYFSHFLITNKLHNHPWQKRGRIYERQAAFTISLVISYCRPFTKSKGLPEIPKRLKPFTSHQGKLHSKILNLRHKIYAHSDGEMYSVKPVGDEIFHTSIISSNSFMLNKTDLRNLQSMMSKMLKVFRKEQKLLEYYLVEEKKVDDEISIAQQGLSEDLVVN